LYKSLFSYQDGKRMERKKNDERSVDEVLDTLAEFVPIPPEYRQLIADRINQDRNYVPKIGFFGKTGAGKSSLCNALFGQDVCRISNIDPCTRESQELEISNGNKRIVLLDVPGVGESHDRDKEYATLYANLLPEIDLVIWVLKGDDRAFSTDQAFYEQKVKPHMEQGKPFVIALNQIDKIEPFREWDVDRHQPGMGQKKNIDQKRSSVAGFFGVPLSAVVPVSASEKYGLVDLLDFMISQLPKERKITVLKQTKTEYRSEKSVREAENGFFEHIIDIVEEYVPVRAVISAVTSVAKKVIGWFGSWF
jgi:small GTP-binding protein